MNRGSRQNAERLGQEWSRRSSAFYSAVRPYIGYFASSVAYGIAMLAAGIFYFYAKLLNDPPEPAVMGLILTAVLLPCIASSPIRTWLVQADYVYWRPMGHRLAPYFRRSLIRSCLVQGIGIAVLWTFLWPLAATAHGRLSVPDVLLTGLVLAALKCGSVLAVWRTRHIVHSGVRRLFIALRWGASALVLWPLLALHAGQAALFALLVAATFAAALRLPRQDLLPWLRHVAEEQRSKRTYVLWLRQAVELPDSGAAAARRPWLSWVAGRLPYARRSGYLYLYLLTLIRSETGLLLLRQLALVGLLLPLAAEPVWMAVLYGAGAFMTGTQLAAFKPELRHRTGLFWLPLPAEGKESALRRIRLPVQLLILLLWLLPVALAGGPLWLLPVLLGTGGLITLLAIRND